jgi:hypothetical protein
VRIVRNRNLFIALLKKKASSIELLGKLTFDDENDMGGNASIGIDAQRKPCGESVKSNCLGNPGGVRADLRSYHC